MIECQTVNLQYFTSRVHPSVYGLLFSQLMLFLSFHCIILLLLVNAVCQFIFFSFGRCFVACLGTYSS